MSELRTNRIVPRDGLPAGAAGGGIIQVRNTTVTDTDTLSCTSAWVDSEIACSITPQSASNKILISMSATGEGNAANQEEFGYRIKKAITGGATTYLTGATAGSRTLLTGVTGDNTADATVTASSFSFSNFLDSPATTSAVTYTLQITYANAGGSGTYYMNRQVSDADGAANGRYISWMTLMEVTA